MGFIYTAATPPRGARRGTADSRTNGWGSVTLPLESITAHGAAGRAAIPFGIAVDTCQVNGRPAGHLTLMVGLGVVSTDRHPFKGTGGEVRSGDVTHGVRSFCSSVSYHIRTRSGRQSEQRWQHSGRRTPQCLGFPDRWRCCPGWSAVGRQ